VAGTITVVEKGFIVTMDTRRSVYPNGSVVIEGDRIVDVGEASSISESYKPDRVISAEGCIVTPGFICAHTHLYGILLRGASSGLPPPTDFTQSLQRIWWPMDQAMTHRDAYASALASSLELLRTGTTTFADTFSGPNALKGVLDDVEKGVDEVGIRGILSFEATERRSGDEGRMGVEENLRFIKKRKQGLCRGMMSLHASFTVSDDLISFAAEKARELKAPMTIHAAEGKGDLHHNLERYGLRTLERLSSVGFLGHDVVLAHVVHVNDDELRLIRGSGAAVAHNPMSNMLNAVGVSPVDEMLKMGICVALGNDGYIFDVFENMRSAFLSHKLKRCDPRVISPLQALEMATVDAARAYGLHELGSLEKGKKADLVLLRPDLPTPLTPSSVYGHLVNTLGGGDVDTVLVDGQVLLERGRPTKLDPARAYGVCREAAEALWVKLSAASSQVDFLKSV